MKQGNAREVQSWLPDQRFSSLPRSGNLLPFGIAALVAVADLVTPAELDIPLLYSLALLACAWTRSRRILLSVMALVVPLVYAGAILGKASNSRITPSMIWTNRTLTVAGLVLATAILSKFVRGIGVQDQHADLVRRLARSLNQAQAIIRTVDGTIVYWSEGATRLYGWSAADALHKSTQELLHTQWPAPSSEIDAAVQRDGNWSGELGHTRKDQSTVWVASQWVMHKVDGQPAVIIEIDNDITILKETEAALAASERRFRRLSDAEILGIVVTDSNNILEANDYFLNLMGYSRADLDGRLIDWGKLTGPADRERSVNALHQLEVTGTCHPFEMEYQRKDGKCVPVLVGSVTVDAQFLSFVIDQTDRKKAEAQLIQARKMESIGLLAGGVAHDFNNLLTIIMGYSEMALAKLPPDSSLIGDVQQIAKAAERAAGLTRQLLTFSRNQPVEIKNLRLNEVLRNLNGMLRRLIAADVEIVLELAEDSGVIQADPVQIEQVILNLAVNARDAMPDGGKLLIETSRVLVDREFAAGHVGLQPGSHIMLSVSDTGTGMSPEVRARIFEPFFSTKETGKGTGLGLATVYGIVKQMEGAIWVYSDPGQGSVFKLLLPTIDAAADSLVQDARVDLMPQGDATILLAEDEPDVRSYICKILERQGYRVLQAENGRQALEIAGRHHGVIHLLLTDVVMPEKGGDALAGFFTQTHPRAPVLRMSGYTDRMRRKDDIDTAYIQKPFTAAALLTRVRNLLAAA